MATLSKIVSLINVEDNQATDIKLTQSLLVKNVKQVALVIMTEDFNQDFNADFYAATASLVRLFDRQTYAFDAGATLHFTAAGGTIDASSQITSILTHGDGVVEVVGYSGNPVVTVGVNIFPRQRTGSVVIQQNTSALTELINWVQDAAE